MDDDVLLLFEAVDIRDPVDDLLLSALLCGCVPEQDSAVGTRDPAGDGCERDCCDSSVGRCDSIVCGRDPPSLGGWELLVDGRDPVVDTRDPVLLPLLITPSRVLPFVLPVLPEASFTDDLLDGRLSTVLLSHCLLDT